MMSNSTHVYKAVRLLNFLHLFIPKVANDVPATSILRQFVGESAFDYRGGRDFAGPGTNLVLRRS